MPQKNHDNAIDILKGIGILLVIVGHSYGPVRNFIYLFHMPLFFLSAGWCFSQKYTETVPSLFQLVIKRIKSLWIPYAVGNSIFILLNNFFISIGLYTTNVLFLETETGKTWGLAEYFDVSEVINRIVRAMLFCRSTQLTGPTWFLEVLFFSTIYYAVVCWLFNKVLKKETRMIPITLFCIISFCIAYYYKDSSILSKFRAGTILETVLLIHIGVMLKKVYEKIEIPKTIRLLIPLFACAVLVILSEVGFVELSNNEFTDPIFLIICSLLGWIFVYGLSCLINTMRETKIKETLILFGQNSLPIIFVHCLFFKPVTFLQMKIYSLPSYYLASFPVLKSDDIWWVIYSIVSILFSYLFILVWRKIKSSIQIATVK